MSDLDTVEKLVFQAEEMPDGPQRIEVYEEAIRISDALEHVGAGYWARMALVQAATFSGYQERGLVAFAWCLARFDEYPDAFDDHELLWRFKWILAQATGFASISRERIIGLQEDMEKRLTQFGYNHRPILYLRVDNHAQMGELDEALKWYEKWKLTSRDEMADCAACEQDKAVMLMTYLKRDEEALAKAEPIFSGRMTCAEIPGLTFGRVIRPLIRLGKMDEAKRRHEEGFNRLTKNREFTWVLGEQLVYLTRVHDLAKAVRVFEKHLPWAVESKTDTVRFRYYAASSALLNVCARSQTSCSLLLPEALECFDASGKYETRGLAEWFHNQSQSIADRLNERNGNTFYSEWLQETESIADPDN